MFSDPLQNLKALGLKENMIVADLGAGTGYYSIAVAHLVPQGKVYAVEVIKDFLTTIQNKIKDAHLNNVETIWGNVEKIGGTKLASGIVDSVIVSNILFQVEDKTKFIEEIKRILKVGGKVLLIDWSDSLSGVSKDKIVSKAKAKEMFEKSGLIFDKDVDAGAHHYGIILIKQ